MKNRVIIAVAVFAAAVVVIFFSSIVGAFADQTTSLIVSFVGTSVSLFTSSVLTPIYHQWRFGGWLVQGEGGKFSSPWTINAPLDVVQLIVSGSDPIALKMKLGSAYSGGGFVSFSFDASAPGGVSAPGLTIDPVGKIVKMDFPVSK